ncbi:hypothetical protein [Nocardia brasiliensis]|uniref:hypothetical protein n=1 Tax=Nocardia brasiliensis TaxID=37326 RepID=UPI0024553157|nr:hypothetical protein [Nocardia brasiliensis]
MTNLRSVAVIGTGLIGTSVALALRRRGIRTYLQDRDPGGGRPAPAGRGGGIGSARSAPVAGSNSANTP